jgi:hypothetical protein
MQREKHLSTEAVCETDLMANILNKNFTTSVLKMLKELRKV